MDYDLRELEKIIYNPSLIKILLHNYTFIHY